MSFDRRRFLKTAGLSALVGLGGQTGWELLRPGQLEAAQVAPNPARTTGKHWAMVVDLTKFHSEKDVEPLVEACHHFHNVPLIHTNQNIKWIWATHFDHAFTNQMNKFVTEKHEHTPVLVMCNHCENPPCVRVCPTQATFKRESDGLVLMDMHRCIGCRFCMAACPYGSRSFNFGEPRDYLPKDPKTKEPKPYNPDYPTRTKGVVEKCNFCAERLAVGKMPICVEASKDGQLLFGDLADPRSAVRKALRENFSIRRKPDLGTGPSVYYLV